MITITLLGEKGGIAKTSLAVHLAAGLAMRGFRVLLVDADAQASATELLGLPESGGFYKLLRQDAEWRDVLVVPNEAAWSPNPDTGRLLVLPGGIETRVLPQVIGNENLLCDRLVEMAGRIDVVVIDTPPTPSLLNTLITRATDHVVYPTLCDALSITALHKSIGHISPFVPTLGIQPTMYRASTVAQQHGLKLLHEHYGEDVWKPVNLRITWAEAAFARQTLFVYQPNGPAANEARLFVEDVMGLLELTGER